MKLIIRIVALLAVSAGLTLASGDLLAHPVTLKTCEAPTRPQDEQDDVLWQRFLTDIDTFRECAQAHMVWHQDAVIEHQQSAKLAMEQWNVFVRDSLNAPEDFPFPEKKLD
ncbi:MAG: hypothetical protein ACI9UU_000465 [Candidatus Azotimanducaceae bacterium]|jgi:hypothetical protein